MCPTMPVEVSAIMIGVEDLAPIQEVLRRARGSGPGSCVSSKGSGFRGFSFHYIVPTRVAVDEAMGKAVAAGARTATSGRSPLHLKARIGADCERRSVSLKLDPRSFERWGHTCSHPEHSS